MHLSTVVRRRLTFLAFAAPAIVLLGVMLVYPLARLLQMSVSDVGIRNILRDWPFSGFDNFASVLSSDVVRSVIVQTVFFVVAVLVVTMLAGTAVALVLKSNRRFSLFTQTTLILVWTMPAVIMGSLWKFLLTSDGAVNRVAMALGLTNEPVPFLALPSTALLSIVLVTIWVGVPFAALVIKSAILDVPDEVLNAARIDGASSWQILTHIVLPMIRPTLLILAVLTVVGAFKAFDLIYVMTKGGPGSTSSTLPFLGYITAFQDYQFGDAAAISVISMAFVLVLAVAYMFAVRREQRA
jgi:multiple sugar transport system permease protein